MELTQALGRVCGWGWVLWLESKQELVTLTKAKDDAKAGIGKWLDWEQSLIWGLVHVLVGEG